MDPFTQRMLERARARQEKIDQKLANSGQAVPRRKPLAENILKNHVSPVKSPIKNSRESISSPKKQSEVIKHDTPVKKSSETETNQIVLSQKKPRNDVVVTKKEFKNSKRNSITRRNSDVSVEINISHRNDIQIEVQVEERDAPISIVYDPCLDSGNNVIIKEIEDDTSNTLEKNPSIEMEEKTDKPGLRHNFKSRLDRLGNLYSDKPNLSSPIHRTEQEFTSATPPSKSEPARPKPENKKKFGRLAALADQINNWEDDLSHHNYHPESKKSHGKEEKLDASTLDISIHSFKDINKAIQSANTKSDKNQKHINSNTFKKPVNECQRLEKKIVAELVSDRLMLNTALE